MCTCAEKLVRNLIRPHARIGPGCHCDCILSLTRNHDRSAARGPPDDPHQSRIDTVATQQIEGQASKGVRADGAGHHDFGTGTAGSQRLISAFPTGEKGIVTAEYGLARPGKARDRDYKIDVYRTENHDHFTAAFSGGHLGKIMIRRCASDVSR